MPPFLNQFQQNGDIFWDTCIWNLEMGFSYGNSYGAYFKIVLNQHFIIHEIMVYYFIGKWVLFMEWVDQYRTFVINTFYKELQFCRI